MTVKRTMQIRCLLACLMLLAVNATGVSALSDERVLQVKAAFLLNFLKFTNWPDDAFDDKNSPIVVAVLGEDPFNSVLERTFRGRTVHGRGIEINRHRMPQRKHFQSDKDFNRAVDELFEKLNQSHLLFISVEKEGDVVDVLNQIEVRHVLTVGDDRDDARNGTSLALDEADGKIVFYANLKAIDATRLKVSSKLLRLARVVESEESENE